MSVYTELHEANVKLDWHESDLYVRDCDEARAILRHCSRRLHITVFYDDDNQLWYDVPFAFDPYWEARVR